MTLRANIDDADIRVIDTDGGGCWYPSDEAAVEIMAAVDPMAKAVAMCDSEPMRGEWRN